ncbi:uncharacterized protein [Clytia hemisphaerica]|uniref:uncharacterized protein isoform X2 n=1 Tax=Clytia hemisphaerica TaxID=252671 RepID=UPI0034D5EABD
MKRALVFILCYYNVVYTYNQKRFRRSRWAFDMAASKKNMDHKYDLNQIENDILAEVMHENHLNDVEDGPSRDNLYTEKNIRHRASLDLSNKREQQQTADELSRLHKMGAKLLESYYDEMKRGTSEKFDDDDDMDEINF